MSTTYLEAIRDIERRIQKAEQQSAEIKLPTMERPSSIPEVFEDHANLPLTADHADVAARGCCEMKECFLVVAVAH